MRLTFGLAAIVLVLASCSPRAGNGSATAATAAVLPARHPESGLLVIPLRIMSRGRAHAFRVEVARDTAEQARGLMFRKAMGANEGMIFPMEPARDASFWMRNTVIPLDIVFIGPDGRILNIRANAVPYSEAPLDSAGKVKAVLELNGGRSAELGIAPGDTVTW